MALFIAHFIILPNINQFSIFLTVRIRRQFVTKILLQIPPHLKYVATLPCKMSDDALHPATPLTSCVINVDRAWHVASNQPGLKFGQLCGLECSSTDGLLMLTIHDNQPAEASDHH